MAGAALVGACGNGGDGSGDAGDDAAGPSCDYDDSDGPDTTFDLEIGETREGYICPQGDEDWYNFETSRSRSILGVSLQMSTPLTDVTPTYAIHEPGGGGDAGVGDVVARPSDESAEKELEVEHCLGKGSYNLVVRDRGNDDSDLRRPYRLSLSTAENPDDAEPNDERSEAISLQPGTPKDGYIACRGDIDWYELQVPQGKILRFFLEAGKLSYQPAVALYPKGDDQPLARAVNEASPRKETSLDRFVILSSVGTYYLAVSDDDDGDADASGAYSIRYELVEDSDPNEPNNDVDEATDASQNGSCSGSAWTTALDTTGTIGAPGDADWFKIPLRNCNPGVLEAEMQIETTGLSRQKRRQINDEIQANIEMIRPDTDSPQNGSCSDDSECRVLDGQGCQEDLDCSRYFERCTSQGKCAGAGVCLPGGNCGAKQVQRNWECDENFESCDPDSGEEPPLNRAAFAAPIFGDDVVYLRVSDYQFDGSAPSRIYSLKVRTRSEPDANEPNNVFVNNPESHAEPNDHRERAKQIPIYDCTAPTQTQQALVEADASDTSGTDASDTTGTDGGMSDADAGMTRDSSVDTNMDGVADASMDTTGTDAADADTTSTDTIPADTGTPDGGDGGVDADGGGIDLPDGCCMNKPWQEGVVSYQNDQDWFEYRHPCPGQDCTVRIHYQIDGGPVDTAINVYRDGDTEPWTSAIDVDQQQSHMPRSGTFGGTTSQDRCFYAYHKHRHQNATYQYGINVSDEVESIREGKIEVTNPTSRDWDTTAGQTYSFCIEKISDKCEEPPCKIYEKGPGGCGIP